MVQAPRVPAGVMAGRLILGLDPGLQVTGWGLILSTGARVSHIAHGTVTSTAASPLAQRLVQLADGLEQVIASHGPHEAAVEETFVNRNPASTLKLGSARAISLLVPAQRGLPVAEYTPNLIKKSIVGTGHATKDQVAMMVRTLLPGLGETVPADATDALAIALCHAHHSATARRVQGVEP